MATYPPTLRSVRDNELGDMLWSFSFRILFFLGIKEINFLPLLKIFAFFALALNSKLGSVTFRVQSTDKASTGPWFEKKTYPDRNGLQWNNIFHFKIEILTSVSIVAVLNLARLSGWPWFWHSQYNTLIAILIVQIGLELELERSRTEFFNFCHFEIVRTVAVKFEFDFFIIFQV